MSKGQAYCAGTPLFLKSKLSHGYQLSFADSNPDPILSLINFIIPEAKKSDDLTKHVTKVYLPLSSTSKFGQVLQAIEDYDPPVDGLSLSPPQLEDVFLTVANHCHGSFLVKSDSKEQLRSKENLRTMDSETVAFDMERPVAASRMRINMRHYMALYDKRKMIAMRDIRLWVMLFIIPIIFFAVPFWVPEISILNIISPSPSNGNTTLGPPACQQTLDQLGDSLDVTLDNLRPYSGPDTETPNLNTSCCDFTYLAMFNETANITTIDACVLAGIPQCLTKAVYRDVNRCESNFYSYCAATPWICQMSKCCDFRRSQSPFYVRLYFSILYMYNLLTHFSPANRIGI